MLRREEEVDVEVRWEDQQQINEFGRLNTRLNELRGDTKALKGELDNLDDATTELMTGDGGKVNLQLGDAFVVVEEEFATEYCEKKQSIAPAESATQYCEKKQEGVQAKLDALSREEDSILKRQAELKKILYARFGASINLEA
ncbi:hypothetical protein JKP88DRAFT_348137 [Tribonema minus]|uniref:Prefoldin subunit 4 n=1 Tax=Tribonema minus TaxID=303371 RepID=A0A835Z9N6_9STRA|nr:hypothetical protein JKP88DRAFT_348137 [Tribonema minus]